MPRGGRRPGAGRKPGSGKGVVLGMDGTRLSSSTPLPPAVTPEERAGLLHPPESISEAGKTHWRRLAPLAIAERTLTPSTEPGFVELCARLVNLAGIDATITRLGPGTFECLPYLKERRGQAALVSASMKDFKLTAFGKPATSEKPKAANPFAAKFGGGS